ncbi:LOW QUALITY PROTEIN: hypothetical protein T265_12519 [Opisthorchis viverrini]|uniref:Uncharacterized protein n=1 Tax=Opisthorchis viverrini TaxID=6198 RepID=A0A075AJS8_OPIVI|nr:LOW QUALITY PROTEIN: hypothetical protein T265_12519 [Opisthorchis viverrini]KER33909.1 LOW QUALITY PROTEIN: hypothetical protein T265_12519 [Opisthorchis viverrini]
MLFPSFQLSVDLEWLADSLLPALARESVCADCVRFPCMSVCVYVGESAHELLLRSLDGTDNQRPMSQLNVTLAGSTDTAMIMQLQTPRQCVEILVARLWSLVVDQMAVDLFTEPGNWLANVSFLS